MLYIMRELMNRLGKDEEKGQTLLEYALIIALIVIVVILVMGPLGTAIAAKYTEITGKLS